jgi:hypothetical protein
MLHINLCSTLSCCMILACLCLNYVESSVRTNTTP